MASPKGHKRYGRTKGAPNKKTAALREAIESVKLSFGAKVKAFSPRDLDAYYRRTYGITAADYDAMLADQGGVCSICKTADPKWRSGRFVVDHCHKKGHVRALLCQPCNLFIGFLEKHYDILDTALAYLAQHRESVRAAQS